MRKIHIHIGGAYRRNPEREVRLIFFSQDRANDAGAPDMPSESLFHNLSPEEKKQALFMVFAILEQALKDESISAEVRPVVDRLLSGARESQSHLDRANEHRSVREFSTDRTGRRYVSERASLEGTMARQRNDYVSVSGGVGRNEALAQGLGGPDALRAHGVRHRIELPEDGTDDEIFSVVREAEKAYQREYTAILHKWAAIRNRCNKRQVFEARKQELENFYTKSELYKQFVDVRDRAEELTRRSYQKYKEQKRRENPPVSVRAPDGRRVGIIDRETGSGAWSPLVTKEQMLQWANAPGGRREGDKWVVDVYPGRSFMAQMTPEEGRQVMRGGYRRRSQEYDTLHAKREARLDTEERNALSPTTPQDFARGYTTVNGERRPLHPSSGYGGSQYPPDYSDHPGYDYRRDPRFSQSTIDHINRQGGDRYMQTQLRLGRMYGDEIAGRLDSGEWKDLGEDPRFKQKYEHVMNVLRRQSQHVWPRQPDQRYGTLAWARSQLEAMQKARRQLNEMEREITGETIDFFEFPVRGEVHDAGVRIVVPQEYRLEGEDGIIAINDPRAWGEGPFWHGRGETYAHAAGIRVQKIPNIDGSVRGIRVEFTQPGIYEVNGRRKVVVAPKGKRTFEDLVVKAQADEESNDIKAAINKGKFKRYQLDFGRQKPRELWIKKDDGESFTVNPNPPEGESEMYVREGIKLVRVPGPNYVFQIYFTKPGYYELQAIYRNGHPAFHPSAKITVPEFPHQSQA